MEDAMDLREFKKRRKRYGRSVRIVLTLEVLFSPIFFAVGYLPVFLLVMSASNTIQEYVLSAYFVLFVTALILFFRSAVRTRLETFGLLCPSCGLPLRPFHVVARSGRCEKCGIAVFDEGADGGDEDPP